MGSAGRRGFIALQVQGSVLALPIDGFVNLLHNGGARFSGALIMRVYVLCEKGEALRDLAKLRRTAVTGPGERNHKVCVPGKQLNSGDGIAVLVIFLESEHPGEPFARGVYVQIKIMWEQYIGRDGAVPHD